ncbi:MAG: hypothetical protein ACPGGK_17475 [Pikeienuella sp.]
MNRNLVILAVVILGVPIGYTLRDTFESSVQISRTERAVGLFREYCLPYVNGTIVKPKPPLAQMRVPGEYRWADPDSEFTLSLTERTCGVSDILAPMTTDEQAQFQAAAEVVVRTEFSMLNLDKNTGLGAWDLAQVWVQFPLNDSRRWGVLMMRVVATGETTFSISFRDAGSRAERLRQTLNE